MGGELSLFPEGFAFLRTMVREFKDSGFDVVAPLHKKFQRLASLIDTEVKIVRGSLLEMLHFDPDAALLIGPEPKLAELTEWFEKKGIRVLGSDGKAVRLSGDKWATYLRLKAEVRLPNTWRKPPNIEKAVAKPVRGVGSTGVKFFNGKRSGKTIFQEFINGTHASCCLMVTDHVTPLSLNEQEVFVCGREFRYSGSRIPLELNSHLSRECESLASKSAKLLGVRGLCGVDMVIRKTPYFIEMNPRITTSFVGLTRVIRENLAEMLIKGMLEGIEVKRPTLKGHAVIRIYTLRKSGGLEWNLLDELKEIRALVTPPVPFGRGRVSRMVLTGSGKKSTNAQKEIKDALERISGLLGVGVDAFSRY